MPLQRSISPRLAILPLGVSGRLAPWRQHTPSTRIARLCACLCLSVGVACASHVEAAPPEASSSVLRGAAKASAGRPRARSRPQVEKAHPKVKKVAKVKEPGELLAQKGFQKFELEHGGYNREFHVYVPKVVTETHPAQGLVMFFHGMGVSVDNTCGGQHNDSFSVVPQADLHGFIAVCPQGLSSKPEDSGWNCEVCCGYPTDGNETGKKPEPEIDDVGFVSAMLDKLRDDILPGGMKSGKKLAYPTKNVFAFGFSTGGCLSYRLACELKDKIHGIAPSGATFDFPFGIEEEMRWPAECKTSVPVWSSLGTEDQYTNETEGVDGFVKYAKLLQCEADSCAQTPPELGVECISYTRCADGHQKARHCIYDGAPHAVRDLLEIYDHGHVFHAWKFLATGVHKEKQSGPTTWIKIRRFLLRSRHVIKYGCKELAEQLN